MAPAPGAVRWQRCVPELRTILARTLDVLLLFEVVRSRGARNLQHYASYPGGGNRVFERYRDGS